jgi:hypothetical protein
MAEAETDEGAAHNSRGGTYVNSFAGLLSEGWETSGDGIYRRVEDAPSTPEDLADALKPGHQPEPPDDENARLDLSPSPLEPGR